MQHHRLFAVLFAPLALACADRSLGDDGPRDVNAPEVQVRQPARGTVLRDRSVAVLGTVADRGSGIDNVVVNGQRVAVDPDGNFELRLDVGPGTTLIQTTATDKSGNVTSDTRGVLAGPFVPQDQPVSEAFVARISSSSLMSLGELAGRFTEQQDLGAIAQGFNPIVEAGDGCLASIRANIKTIDKSHVDMALAPMDGGVRFTLDVRDLDVGAEAAWDVLCAGGDSDIDIRARRFRLSGEIDISLDDDGSLSFDVVAANNSFDDLEIDFGLVPDSLTGFVTNVLDGTLSDVLVDSLQELLPMAVEDYFDGFMTASRTITVFGRELRLGLRPTELTFTRDGGYIATDTNIHVARVSSPGYVSTSRPSPDLSTAEGFRVAVADDALNQVLTSLWAAKALDISVTPGTSDASRLAELIDRLDFTMKLPPVVSADNDKRTVEVTIGDLFIDVVDEQGMLERVVTRIAIAAVLQLTVSTDQAGLITVEAMTPTLWVDVLDEGVDGSNPLSDDQIEELASAVGARLPGLIDNALRAVPIPMFAGATIDAPAFDAAAGYFTIGGTLVVPEN